MERRGRPMRDELVPGTAEILGWIERIYARDYERFGYERQFPDR